MMPQDAVMQELNARHSASVAAKLDAMKQQQQQQQHGQGHHGQGQSQGLSPWGQQQGPRPLPGRSLTPGSDFWRQTEQDPQRPASQGLQEASYHHLTYTSLHLRVLLEAECLDAASDIASTLASPPVLLRSSQISLCQRLA
jgi:hypothetical protein